MYNLLSIHCYLALPSEVQQPILVCTAHIHWDPEFCDVKLIQIMMLSNELNTILEEANRNYRNVNHHQPPIQLLLCGDFNSLPDSGMKLLNLCVNYYCTYLIFFFISSV